MAKPIWPQITLADLVERGQISYGVVQPGSEDAAGVPIVRVKDLRNGAIQVAAPARVSEQIAERHARTVLHGGEVLVTLVGTVGEAAVVPPELAGWNVARAVAVLRPAGVAPEWLRLCFRTESVIQQIAAAVNTTVQTTLNLSDLKRVRIPVPGAPVRRRIAEVLGALDDKIAANARLATTADEWVRAAWARTCVNADTTRPVGSLVDSIRDLIDPRDASSDHVYVGLEHIPRRQMWLPDHGLADSVTSAKSGFLEGDVLFGKLRPYFHKVVAAPKSGICSTDVLVLRAQESTLRGFVLAALASDATVAAATASSEGTRMPRTSWKDLAAIEVPWPGSSAAEAFSSEVEALRATVDARLAENVTLAAIRDALLPALMSGTLRVHDAERAAESLT